MSQVWDSGPTDRGELLVLLALADFANDDGECWPSLKTVGERARMTERGVRKILRRLEDTGWLKTVTGGGRGGANRYVVCTRNPEPETRNAVPPEPETRNRSAKTRNGSAETRNGGSAKPSRTIKEPSEDIARALCGVLSPDVAAAFIDHRRGIKKPLTVKAAEIICKKLRDHPDPDAVVEDSIANGWQGVFPKKGNENDKPSKQDERMRAFIEGARSTS